MNATPTIGWSWWIIVHVVTIALLLYWGAAAREPKEPQNHKE